MKTSTIIQLTALVLITTTAVFTQDIQPGIYRYTKDQNQAKVTVSGTMAVIKSYWTNANLTKKGSNKYEDQTSGWNIEVVSKDIIRLGYKDNAKDELTLYSPENHVNENSALFSKDVNGDRYYALNSITPEYSKFEGEYLYQGGAPKVRLYTNEPSYFQRHEVSPDPIKKWGIETNYKGEVQKLVVGENEKLILLIEYENGTTQRMEAVVLKTPQRKIVIMGERIKTW
jgi:hypothetical protein